MSRDITLGGERLGSGKKQKVHLKGFERSNQDTGYVFRTTMSAGTLVPFLADIGLPSDEFDIELQCEVLTHPTIGPLFSSMKVQLDVFSTSFELYNRGTLANLTGIGLDPSKIYLPQIRLVANNFKKGDNPDTCQINPSSIFHYLGISGLGNSPDGTNPVTNPYGLVSRLFNGLFYLNYFDIYKPYYANKQEEVGYIIHNPMTQVGTIVGFNWNGKGIDHTITTIPMAVNEIIDVSDENNYLEIVFDTLEENFDIDRISIEVTRLDGNVRLNLSDVYEDWDLNAVTGILKGTTLKRFWPLELSIISCNGYDYNSSIIGSTVPKLTEFPLSDIDNMRLTILGQELSSPLEIGEGAEGVYSLPFTHVTTGEAPELKYHFSATSPQEGLLIKCYQSDLFNNWLNKEWIDGESGVGGISNITKVDTTGNYFTIDELLVAQKMYNMLNRTAVGDGTYNTMIEVRYDVEVNKRFNSPIYHGGLSKELVFNEVISQSATNEQPLGSLAGRGTLNGKHLGGKVKIDCNGDYRVIMGIVSITPRIMYSQGNRWFNNLKSLADFHTPDMDGIGFQNLMTDQLHWCNTRSNDVGHNSRVIGKSPSWINYQTDYDQAHGNFADRNQQMYMILNRRVEHQFTNAEQDNPSIKDLTTYIDPSKYNYIFADTRLDAQNFWMHIKVDRKVRRKMSANVMPNL